MKKLIQNFLVFGLIGILSTACSKDYIDEPLTEERPMAISLSLTGDISVEHESLTKASTNDLYGINVYYDKDKNGTIDDIYGYGLFDDVSKMTITLISGYKYKFDCTLVKDGKTKLYSSNVGKYEAPFGQIMENKFVLGTGVVMSGITSGTARMYGETSDTKIPKLDRYYGETTDYQPSENGKVEISLKRCSFGVKYIINGLVDGSLDGYLEYNDDYRVHRFGDVSTETNSEGDVSIYSFANVRECWADEALYTIDGTVKMKYNSNRGTFWDIEQNKNVSFKRNTLAIITVNVNPDLSSASMQFSLESMTDENEINLGINGNGLIDNVVEPNE